MDVGSDGSMLHEWSFAGHVKRLAFHMERCIGCDLCRIICPAACIELGPVPEITSGQLEGVPPILIDFEACAYCGLCARVCPTGAFAFSTDPPGFIDVDALPRFQFAPFVSAVQARMARSFDEPASKHVHPPDDIDKPAEGEVILRRDFFDRCDPAGCKGCLTICPTDCFWVPKKAADLEARGKIAMDADLCIHCGACKNACPQRVIEVRRTSVRFEIPGQPRPPWAAGWERAIHRLVDPEYQRSRYKAIPVPVAGESHPAPEEATVISQLPPEIKRQLQERLDVVKASLAQVNVRYWMEFGKLDALRKAMAKLQRG